MRFLLEIPVKDRVAIQVVVCKTRGEAEAALRIVLDALDAATAAPVPAAALIHGKAASLIAQGPFRL